jgi:triphosphoribosyl-dephospho-CoA synthase
MTRRPVDARALENAYLEACEAELRAFKPGNVSVYSEGHDMTVADFRASARASAPCLCNSALSLGERIYHAIHATRDAVGCNTNLGIVLLSAPLLLAVQAGADGGALRQNVARVLAATTIDDADWVYRAIRLAAPGGLGESAEHDVREAPTVTLLEAMRAAENRDRIAWQYGNRFQDVFELAIPSYHRWIRLWGDEQWATVAVFAGLLRVIPDSHIERKFGSGYTGKVIERMTEIERIMAVTSAPERLLPVLEEVDAEFKNAGINPGTTADLTVACLLAVRLEKLGLCGVRER